MSNREPHIQSSLFQKTLQILGSYTLGIILMGVLLILTFCGTIYQTLPGLGMSATQAAEEFFGASYVLIPLGGHDALLALPLPGMWIISCLLFINLLTGGIIKARKGFSKWGVLITHIGILVLLASVALGNRMSRHIEDINLVPGHVYHNDMLDFGIKLHQFTPEFYPGTGKPKSFESEVSIIDSEGNEAEHALIRMNEPLRYRGWTFYQKSYSPWQHRYISILSAANNPFEQWPKWASYIISFGLLWHFGFMFTRYLKANARKEQQDTLNEHSEDDEASQPIKTSSKFVLGGIILFVVALLGIGLMSAKPNITHAEIKGYTPWSRDFVEQFGSMGLEEGGRIKPVSTYAGFSMLRSLGKRSLNISVDGSKHKISPVEWMLDAIFRPEYSNQYPVFLVNREEVVSRLGLPDMPDKRKRYSYNQLLDKADEIFKQAALIQNMDTPGDVDRDILGLAVNMWFLEQWNGMVIDMLQDPASMERSDKRLPKWFKKADGTWKPVPDKEVSKVFALASINAKKSRPGNNLLAEAETLLKNGMIKSNTQHLSPEDIQSIERESLYYRVDPMFKALVLFIAAFVILVIGSFFGTPGQNSGKLKRAISAVCGRGLKLPWLLGLAGASLLLFGMILRMMITMRSPVGNTYETILFIACSGALITLIIELTNKKGIALAAGLVLGAAGCQMGIMYEAGQAADHMDPLVAVLRSNFLLSTHVITIVLGYASALLAGVFSHIYILSKPFGLLDHKMERSLTRMAYGTLCFSLLFTLIGTVFGGIWGNEAWGRFWGWDPKENGALIIILWQLMLLHARLAGYAREWGLHIGNIAGVILIAFAWWGVNTLGVGLHSYGFSDAHRPLMIFYIAEAALLLLSILIWWKWRKTAPHSA